MGPIKAPEMYVFEALSRSSLITCHCLLQYLSTQHSKVRLVKALQRIQSSETVCKLVTCGASDSMLTHKVVGFNTEPLKR